MKDIASAEEPKSKPSLKRQILIAVFFSAVVGFSVYFLKPTKTQLPFPFTSELMDKINYSCESLVGTSMYGQDEKSYGKGIFAEIFKGTDKIAIEINNDKLYFLTKAALESGIARDEEPFTIIKNTNNQLIAIDSRIDKPAQDINIFALNKTNGIAVWTKTSSDYFPTKNPAAQSYYLVCR